MHTHALPVAIGGQPVAAADRWPVQRLLSLFLGLSLGLMLAFTSAAARAEDDPPGRVGRLADFNGSVSWWDNETGEWADAERNRPLSTGDRVSTAVSGRAELRVGSSVLRLSNNTEVEVLRLDDEKLVFQLHSGSVALRVRSREIAEETEVITDEARLLPQRAGHYRFDRMDDTTQAGSWRGELRVADADGVLVGAGQRVELYRQGRGNSALLRSANIAMADDGFSEWVGSEDQREERTASSRYVSPEMTGAEELDRHGRWEQHPEYGALWLPLAVQADWAPYRHGRWAWVRPWGWTWIDEAPWGFAPFHYGRWVSWRGRWGWVPGAYVQRPVYAPALVAWVGGGGWGISVQIGGPTVGWVPLAPREVYRPHYRSTPRYVDRVNPTPPYRWRHAPNHVPTGPISYGNQGVPNGVTVVSSDVLVRRQPVARGVLEVPRGGPRQPLAVLPAPPAPAGVGQQPPRRVPPRGPGRDMGTPVQMVPGGAQPVPRPDPRPEGRPGSRPEMGVTRPDRPQDRDEDGPARRPFFRDDGRENPRVQPGFGGRPERAERPERVDRPERADRPEREQRPDRADRPADRAERPDRQERPDRSQRPEPVAPRAEPPRPAPAAPPVERVGPVRPPAAAAPAPQPAPAAERAAPPRPAPAPERAQVPGRERPQDRDRERQSQR